VREAEALQAWINDPQAAPHGGESVMQLSERVAAWLTSLQGASGHIVAVTHPFVVRAALMQVLQGAAFNAVDVNRCPWLNCGSTASGGYAWRVSILREHSDETTAGHRHRRRKPRLHHDAGGESA